MNTHISLTSLLHSKLTDETIAKLRDAGSLPDQGLDSDSIDSTVQLILTGSDVRYSEAASFEARTALIKAVMDRTPEVDPRDVIVSLIGIGLIAIMCEGELYCPDCTGTVNQGDLDDSYVTLVTQSDIDCGAGKVSWLEHSSCSACGSLWSGN